MKYLVLSGVLLAGGIMPAQAEKTTAKNQAIAARSYGQALTYNEVCSGIAKSISRDGLQRHLEFMRQIGIDPTSPYWIGIINEGRKLMLEQASGGNKHRQQACTSLEKILQSLFK
jgi:hypothetical protein